MSDDVKNKNIAEKLYVKIKDIKIYNNSKRFKDYLGDSSKNPVKILLYQHKQEDVIIFNLNNIRKSIINLIDIIKKSQSITKDIWLKEIEQLLDIFSIDNINTYLSNFKNLLKPEIIKTLELARDIDTVKNSIKYKDKDIAEIMKKILNFRNDLLKMNIDDELISDIDKRLLNLYFYYENYLKYGIDDIEKGVVETTLELKKVIKKHNNKPDMKKILEILSKIFDAVYKVSQIADTAAKFLPY